MQNFKYNKTGKEKYILRSFWSFCVPLPKIPLFWFCVMFVRLAQTGEVQFVLCD